MVSAVRKEVKQVDQTNDMNSLLEKPSLGDIESETEKADTSQKLRQPDLIYVESITVPGNIGKYLMDVGKYVCTQCGVTCTTQGSLSTHKQSIH